MINFIEEKKYGKWKGMVSTGKDCYIKQDSQGNSQYKADIWIT